MYPDHLWKKIWTHVVSEYFWPRPEKFSKNLSSLWNIYHPNSQYTYFLKITQECGFLVSLSQEVLNEGELESQITIFSANEISVITAWSSKAWYEGNTCLVLIRCMSFRQQKTKGNYHYVYLDKVPTELSFLSLHSKVYLNSYDIHTGKIMWIWTQARYYISKHCQVFINTTWFFGFH